MIPHPKFLRRILTNATLIWAGVRFGAAAVGVRPDADLPSIVAIIALTVLLAVLDVRRRHEFPLLENLGVSRVTVILLATLPPVLAEGSCALVVRL
jgi:hypothetical protein